MDPIDHIGFIARSNHRIEILDLLLNSAPMTRHEFRQRLDASRSTVVRSLSALEERGWITREGREYVLTPTGEIVASRFLSLVDAIETTEELASFLEWFPVSEFDFDLEDIEGASVAVSTPEDPYAPARAQARPFEEVEVFRAMLPSIDAEVARAVHGQLVERGFDLELIVTEEVADRMTESEYVEMMGEMDRSGNCRVLVYDGGFPFYLGIGDEVVQIGVEDDEGYPQALLETDTDSIGAWATTVYEDHRKQARELDEL